MSPSPTRVTTAEELDALPVGSVIRDAGGLVMPREDRGWLHDNCCGWCCDSADVKLPATLLYNPAAPSVSDTAAATITEWAVRYPDGHVLPFSSEERARQDHAYGFTPGKVVVCRTVSDWAEPAALGLTVTERSEVLTDKADQDTPDRRPHSRACGIRRHEHGSDCRTNCPTCAGKGTTR